MIPEIDPQLPTAALLTPGGRGAIATIIVDTRRATQITDVLPWRGATRNAFGDIPPQSIAFGAWGTDVVEEVVVARVDVTRWEIHCHGGTAASARILNDLETLGFFILSAYEWTARLRGTLEAECSDALSRATTLRTAGLLLEQSQGALRGAVESLVLPGVTVVEITVQLEAMLRWADFGRHLVEPWRVVVAGLPNAGKSSLINRLLGYSRSIVFAEPGTTRDVVTAITSIAGWPIELADTAGIRDAADELEVEGIRRARAEFDRADLVLYLVDASIGLSDADRALLAGYPDALGVRHKCDLVATRESRMSDRRGCISVSSKTGEGCDSLLDAIAARLVPEMPPSGSAIPVTSRQTRLLREGLAATRRDDRAAFLNAMSELTASRESL